MSVEEVGKVGRRDGGDGRGLVVERGDEDDAGELEVALLGAGHGGMRSVEVEGEAVESSAGVGSLRKSMLIKLYVRKKIKQKKVGGDIHQ